MKRLLLVSSILCIVASAPIQAQADVEYNFDKSTWPIALVKRPLILAPGLLEINGDTVFVNASSGSFADPIRLAPDVYYGLNRKLMIGLDHTEGVCVVGDGCDKRYNDVAVNLVYSLMHGDNMNAAALLGGSLPTIDPLTGGLNLGLIGKVRLGAMAVVSGAHLYVGLRGRDFANPESMTYVRLPVQIQVQAHRQVAFLLDFGFNGPIDGFGDALEIPVGMGGLFTLNSRIDLGAEFQLDDFGDSDTRFDNRSIFVRANVRL